LAVLIAKKNTSSSPKERQRRRNPNSYRNSLDQSFHEIDKATIASKLQLQEQKKDLIYNCIALGMKVGLLVIFAGSFVKLGIASHQRVMRNIEISSVLKLETKTLNELNQRFDRLFTIGGKDRLLGEQDHLIAPNSFRVIWK
tara:strand:+ start:16848 stop:17273 length:426 start_codon:yes stop_codon:yes gene_type:complete